MRNLKIDSNKVLIFSSLNWLKGRENYIGGSESYSFGAEILGKKYLWNTRFTVWCEKSGYKVKKTGAAIKYGIEREPRILQKASTLIECILGLKNEVFESAETYVMRDYPFIGANLDGLVQIENGELIGLEIKTSSHKAGWSHSSIPWVYWNQVQHYMLVTGLKQFFVIAEVCGETLIRSIEANSIYQEELLEKMIAFWFFVESGQMPEMAHVSCEKPYMNKLDAKKLDNDNIEKNITIPDLAPLLKEFCIIKSLIKTAQKRSEKMSNFLKEHIKPGHQMHIGKYILSLYTGNYTSLDSKNLKENEPKIYHKFLRQMNREILCVKELNTHLDNYTMDKTKSSAEQ